MTNSIDIKQTETAFFRSLGDGRKALVHLVDMVSHALNEGCGDTTRLANMYNRIKREKSDTFATRAIQVTIAAVWEGAKVNTKKETGVVTFKVKGCTINQEAVKRMHDCVERKLSLRDTYIKEIKGDKEHVSREPIAVAKQCIKAAKSNGVQREQLIALIEATWNDVTV